MTDTLQQRTAEQALREHGLDGDRLLKLARRIATDAQRRTPAGLGGKYEDLVSFITLQALEAAVRYDTNRVRPGYTFASYLCDIMERRVTDWYRRKSEGFGDSRSGSNGRIVLTGDHIDDHPADEPELHLDETDEHDLHWGRAAACVSTPMQDWQLVNERVVMEWTRAAELQGQTLEEWIRRTLDLQARGQLRKAA